MATLNYRTDVYIDTDDFIEEITTEELVRELKRRENEGAQIVAQLQFKHETLTSCQVKFESSPTAALNVLQDLLGMQHTTTKEQVIEQLKSVL